MESIPSIVLASYVLFAFVFTLNGLNKKGKKQLPKLYPVPDRMKNLVNRDTLTNPLAYYNWNKEIIYYKLEKRAKGYIAEQRAKKFGAILFLSILYMLLLVGVEQILEKEMSIDVSDTLLGFMVLPALIFIIALPIPVIVYGLRSREEGSPIKNISAYYLAHTNRAKFLQDLYLANINFRAFSVMSIYERSMTTKAEVRKMALTAGTLAVILAGADNLFLLRYSLAAQESSGLDSLTLLYTAIHVVVFLVSAVILYRFIIFNYRWRLARVADSTTKIFLNVLKNQLKVKIGWGFGRFFVGIGFVFLSAIYVVVIITILASFVRFSFLTLSIVLFVLPFYTNRYNIMRGDLAKHYKQLHTTTHEGNMYLKKLIQTRNEDPGFQLSD